MSFQPDALPPASQPFHVKLRAAMDVSENYKTQRALAQALGTDGSLVGKWLKGTRPSRRHMRQLPLLLGTPADYFSEQPRGDRLEELAAKVGDLDEAMERVLNDLADTRTRLERLESGRAGRPTGSRRRGAARGQ